MSGQFTEPTVSVAKFESEVAEFRALEDQYRSKGWFLVEAEFPSVMVILASAAVHPPAIVCGVLFDYTNYDASPPSVKLVNPFTKEPYIQSALPTHLNRGIPSGPMEFPGMPGALQIQAAQPLMQAHQPDAVPFLCIAGVREYHEHPGHTADSWDLHRSSGAGRLIRLLEVIHKYGVEPIRGYGVNLVPQVSLDFGEPPA